MLYASNVGIIWLQMYRHCAEIDISGLKDPRLHENTKISALYNLGRLLADQERYQVSYSVHTPKGTTGVVGAHMYSLTTTDPP